MSKIRIPNKFGQTPNDLLNDSKISLKAKGLYGFMQSKPDNWEFSINGLKAELKEADDAIRSGLKELEIFGWLTRESFQNGKGQWDCDYTLNIFPIENNKVLTKKPYAEKPHTEKPHTESSVTGKPPYIIKKEIIKKEEKEILEINTLKKENPKPAKFNAETYLEKLEIDSEIKQNLKAWLEVRKVKRTATTQNGLDLQIKSLTKFPKEIQIKMIQNSVMNGWTGIFELKPVYQNNQTFTQNQPQFRPKPGNLTDQQIETKYKDFGIKMGHCEMLPPDKMEDYL